MYSVMLYMKTRVTFRVAEDLAETLRGLPNQTAFVEAALREALREKCRACGGTGRAPGYGLRVSNLRSASLGVLQRAAALQLKGVVVLARHAAATDVLLERRRGDIDIAFAVKRGDEVLLRGSLLSSAARAEPS
jgi:hypothetical protein